MHARAIETRYKGYRFRSRLEARWAVFFDALGLKWEYEPEGFELPGGVRYLPDFWLPKLNTYVEVKPNDGNTESRRKAWLFSRAAESFIAIASGPPMAGTGRQQDAGWESYLWCYGPFDKQNRDHHVADGSGNWFDAFTPGVFHWGLHRTYTTGEWCDLADASAAARSARFEHGESGARK